MAGVRLSLAWRGPVAKVVAIRHMNDSSSPTDYDVVIFGGASSGSALALLLKRARPETRVLIVEKSEVFDRKVGESTSEVAGCFITRVLGLAHYLSCEHFQKHGLRMWFNTPENECPNCCSEIGPNSQARFPTYQLDRSKLDEHMLELAGKEGCDLLRPAAIKSFELNGAGKNVVVLKHDGETRTITAAPGVHPASSRLPAKEPAVPKVAADVRASTIPAPVVERVISASFVSSHERHESLRHRRRYWWLCQESRGL